MRSGLNRSQFIALTQRRHVPQPRRCDSTCCRPAAGSMAPSWRHSRRSLPLLAASIVLLACCQAAAGARLQPAALLARQPYVNERPIIGILTQPGDPAPDGSSYIAASYVKWVEAAGARVIPIQFDLSERELRERFDAINGLLLPGGGADLRPGHAFFDTAALLVRWAMQANDKGDYFPVQGTCLGLETLSVIISGNTSILAHMDAEDAPAPLLFTEEARESRLLRALPPHVVQHLQDAPLAFENHAHGVLMTSYEEPANQALRDFFKVLSLSLDKKGLPYISTMEAREYPMWATQWHPEKPPFEWATSLHIPHSPDAVEVTQEVANFFVSEARKNSHKPRDVLAEDDALIYNWPPLYTGRHESGKEEQDFQQIYVFRSRRHAQCLLRRLVQRGLAALRGAWGA